MLANNLSIDKNAVRIQYLALRQRVVPKVAAAAGQAVAGHLLDIINVGTIVAGYIPVRGELDVSQAMSLLAMRGHTLCLPVIEASDKPLYFRRWLASETLEKGRYGIDIPPAGSPVFIPDTVIVPLVAFDRAGHRLGYGAGYYDRTIERLRELKNPIKPKDVQIIGVGYSWQEVEYIAPEQHDQKLDVIVTEKGVITPSAKLENT